MARLKRRRAADNRLRVLRAEHRVSQMDAALHLGISQSTYWQIENGFREATPDEQAALAKLLRVRVLDAFPESAHAEASR